MGMADVVDGMADVAPSSLIFKKRKKEKKEEKKKRKKCQPHMGMCQGTSLAACTPLYTGSIIHILHSFNFTYLHLLLFGYHLNLSCSQ